MAAGKVMKHTRSVTFWCHIFILAALCWLGTRSLMGQTANGWGEIWQQRMSIGQARLDEAFKLAESGKATEALTRIDAIINTNPDNWRAHFLKAAVLVLVKRQDDALQQIDVSIKLAKKGNVGQSLLAQLYSSKARTCIDAHRYEDARRALDGAIHIDPNDTSSLNDLAWLLATSPEARVRNPHRAIALAQKCCGLNRWTNAYSIDTLAAAYAAKGDFGQAVRYQQLAMQALNKSERAEQLTAMEDRLKLYSNHQPYQGD
jgi:tetratricopeptide (TPR) repeat protein